VPRRLPENTLPSFEAALALGADGIELDVHATADGVVVVHHDPMLRDGREIRRTEWDQVRASRVAPDVGIPTLLEVCDVVRDRAELFVEIKGAGIEDAVVDVLRGHAGTAAIHSFDHELIGRLSRRGVPHRLGLLIENAPTEPRAVMKRYGALDLWPERRVVTPQLVSDVHAFGGRVLPWTVNDRKDADRLRHWGVDGICTDDVTMLD
jgi:glycerophosphoryl diester phosphodiesterase